MARTKANTNIVSDSKATLNNMKMEVANDLGIKLNQGCNGDLTTKEAGYVGGEMVKRMVAEYKQKH